MWTGDSRGGSSCQRQSHMWFITALLICPAGSVLIPAILKEKAKKERTVRTWAGSQCPGITSTFLWSGFNSKKEMLEHLDSTLDPKCQLVELSWLTVFSHALEFTTNLCEMKIRRGGCLDHILTLCAALWSPMRGGGGWIIISNCACMTAHWSLCMKWHFYKYNSVLVDTNQLLPRAWVLRRHQIVQRDCEAPVFAGSSVIDDVQLQCGTGQNPLETTRSLLQEQLVWSATHCWFLFGSADGQLVPCTLRDPTW